MKLLKYLLFIFILLVQSHLHAQYRGAKNGVAARFIQSNYQFPLNDQFSENDFYGGVELEYTRHLNRFMNVSLPIKYARPLLPVEESGLKVLEGTVLETDLVFQFKYFREKGFIYPTLFAGFGGSIENWESYNYYVPTGISLNFRFRKHAYLSAKGEYRYSLEDPLRHHIVLSAGVFVAIGTGIPIDPMTVDTDKDGIPDVEDECPLTVGVYEVRGCPDQDSDGVPDKDDGCPKVAGLYQFRGCPDRDGDGLQDRFDQCPNIAGSISNDGCPIKDSDGDGFEDDKDRCPFHIGTINGCPDRDGDSVIDQDDRCPNLAGSTMAYGCPDRDHDGVEDEKDPCPDTAGPMDRNGCPFITMDDKSFLKKAAEKIKFKTGYSMLTNQSKSLLDQIAELLFKYSEYKVTIKGFTDSIGSKTENLKLSKQRAAACFEYLIAKGVTRNRISHDGFGESNPIADNRYAAGREKNRRIEFDLYLEK